MRWRTKVVPRPELVQKGCLRTVDHFAWIPTIANDGYTYWLEKLIYTYSCLEDTTIPPGYQEISYSYEDVYSMDGPGVVDIKAVKHVKDVWKLIGITKI